MYLALVNLVLGETLRSLWSDLDRTRDIFKLLEDATQLPNTEVLESTHLSAHQFSGV